MPSSVLERGNAGHFSLKIKSFVTPDQKRIVMNESKLRKKAAILAFLLFVGSTPYIFPHVPLIKEVFFEKSWRCPTCHYYCWKDSPPYTCHRCGTTVSGMSR